MATFFFHEETFSTGDPNLLRLHRYYYNDISAEVLLRSFHRGLATPGQQFVGDQHIPIANLRTDLKAVLTQFLSNRQRQERLAA